MKKLARWLDAQWYNAIYYAIAIATFKHSSWGFSTVLEGPEPQVVITELTPTGLFAAFDWVSWIFFGMLMATAVDVGMFFSARAIREQSAPILQVETHTVGEWVQNFFTSSPWMLWLAFFGAAMLSGYTQLLYAIQHAAPLDVVAGAQDIQPLQDGGWILELLRYRVVILPIVLPGFAVLYTLALKINPSSFMVKTEDDSQPGPVRPVKVPRLTTNGHDTQAMITGANYGLKAAADLTSRKVEKLRMWCHAGLIGKKNTTSGYWEISEEEIARILNNEIG